MLTKKNRAHVSASGLFWTALLLFLFTGCQPSGPKALLLGDKYVRQGDYPKALRYLGRAAVVIPERPEVWNLQGLAYHGSQQPQRAAEAYQRALRIDRNFPPAHFNLGVLLFEQDRINDAITELTAYTNLKPDDDQGWSRLGAALIRARRTDEAERALTQALKLNAKNADAHNSMGLVHIQRKRPREAVQAFNTALQAQPGFSSALLNQAIVAQQYFGNNGIALERYRAYLNSKPNAKAAAAVQLAIRQIEQPAVEAPPPVALADLTTNTGLSALLRSNLALQAERARATSISAPTNLAAQLPRTNPPAAGQIALTKTNIPAPVATQHLAQAAQLALHPQPALQTPPTNPPPTVASVPPPKTTTAAADELEPPLQVEVVKVTQEPELPAAKDLDSATSTPSTATSNSRTTAINSQSNPNTAEEKPLLAPRKKADEKRGLLARLKDPAHWFEKEGPKMTAIPQATPIPPAPTPTAPPAAPTDQTIARAAPPAEPTPPPVIPRYQYRSASPPAKGNRPLAQNLFAQAGNAYQQRQYGEAMKLYRQAVTADPTYFEAAYNLGLLAYQNKDVPLALAANEQAVALKPTSTDARYNFALTLREARYPIDAANELRELLNTSPNEARAHLALANLYAQQLDEHALARTHYQRFLDLAPNHGDAPAVRQWLVIHP